MKIMFSFIISIKLYKLLKLGKSTYKNNTSSINILKYTLYMNLLVDHNILFFKELVLGQCTVKCQGLMLLDKTTKQEMYSVF